MKKLSVLFFTCFFMIVWGSVSYAADAPKLEFKASGMFDVQGFYMENVPPARSNPTSTIYKTIDPDYSTFTKAPFPLNLPDKALNKKVSYWDQRGHIKFDFIMGKELSSTVMFEIDSTRWGDTPGGQGGLISDRGRTGFWSADRASVEVKSLYIDAAIPYFGIPVPMTVRLGVQPLSIRPNVFVYTDGAGITGGIKLDQLVGIPVDIIPYYFKSLEGVDWTADDCDVWGLQAKATVGKITVGGYGLYYNMNTYPFFVAVDPGVPGLPSSLWPLGPGPYKAGMSWLGAYADGAAGPINFNFDFVFDHGKVKGPALGDVNYMGWMSRLKLDFPQNKFNFGAVGMYATGANTEKTDANGTPGGTTSNGETTSKVGSYVVPAGSEQPQSNQESVVFYGMEPGGSTGAGFSVIPSYYRVARGGFGGTWFAKLYTSYKPAPFYKITLQGLYIGDTTKNGNTLGTAVNGDGSLRDNKLIGYELDWLNDFQIYNNLRFWVGLGYLITGPALDVKRGTLNENFSSHNPWALRTRLQYTF